MKNFILLVIPCMILSLFPDTGIGTYLFTSRECYTITYQPEEYVSSNQPLNNPYRGWYHIYGYALSDSEPLNLTQIQETIAKDSNQLVLLEINLRNYAASDISSGGLSQLESILLAWEDAGRQLILRFLYDWNGKAKETEPQDISIIKRHMEQTGEIVNKFANCVFLMQGIYVGNCGEMNNSNYMSLENMRELASHLDSVIDPAIYLSVRTPEHYRIVSNSSEPLSAADAFSGKISSSCNTVTSSSASYKATSAPTAYNLLPSQKISQARAPARKKLPFRTRSAITCQMAVRLCWTTNTMTFPTQ